MAVTLEQNLPLNFAIIRKTSDALANKDLEDHDPGLYYQPLINHDERRASARITPGFGRANSGHGWNPPSRDGALFVGKAQRRLINRFKNGLIGVRGIRRRRQ